MAIIIDYVKELILFTSPTTEVDGQTLHDFIQDEAASPIGMGQPWIDQADPQNDTEILYPDGKIEDPSNPGVFSQIILRLNDRWQMQFWGGSGYTRIFGAKFVGGVGGEVMKATGTAGDITVLESPVDGVTVVSGSGVTEQDKTDIINGVWDNAVESGLSTEDVLKLLLSVAVGKTSIVDLGSGLATVKFRDTADARDRVIAAMSGSVRTTITLDVI